MLNLLAVSIPLIITIVAIVIVAIAVLWFFIGTRNAFVRLRNIIEEAFSTMDVYLKKRYDLIPNLVNTVKGATKYESETLEKVMAARSRAMGAASVNDKIDAEKELASQLRTLVTAVHENYPDLKANSQFMNLSAQLEKIESDLVQARKYYNGTVKTFNTKIELFPQNIVANMMKLSKYKFFEAAEGERENVKVEF